MKNLLKRFAKLLIVLLIAATVIILIWAGFPAGPMPEALWAMQSNSAVEVKTDEWLIFTPTIGEPTTGLILYPGARVDPRSYAPQANEIASHGFLVVIVPMPLNFAIFGSNKAADVMLAFPKVEKWVVGGHSLGGAMAAQFTYNHPDQVEGMALWAAYPASNNNLSEYDLTVISIYGTVDGITTLQDIDASRELLPDDTLFIPIPGGNHAQFGWYGSQSGDNPASITRQSQQELVVTSSVSWLESIEGD